MKIVLDTNVLIQWVRGSDAWFNLRSQYDIENPQTNCFISAVTAGEILALAKRLGWGDQKMNVLDDIFQRLTIVTVDYSNILDVYAELDHFSHAPKR